MGMEKDHNFNQDVLLNILTSLPYHIKDILVHILAYNEKYINTYFSKYGLTHIVSKGKIFNENHLYEMTKVSINIDGINKGVRLLNEYDINPENDGEVIFSFDREIILIFKEYYKNFKISI